MRVISFLVCVFLLISDFLVAQKFTDNDFQAYIKKYKPAAINEMKLYRIPASITLAQGLHESGAGKSTLAIATNNHFGIKCQKEWTGEKYYYDDDEKNECFRAYKSVEESYRDHSLFLATRQRYASLFLLPLTDYKAWAKGLKQAGYATNPEYAGILIRIIENNQLYLLDDTLAIQEVAAVTKPAITEQPVLTPGNDEIIRSGQIKHPGRILFNPNYRFPSPTGFDFLYTSDKGRKVYQNYSVPFIFASKGDTWFSIAKEFEIYGFQIYKQNDLKEDDQIIPGQMLYLEPKKKKNKERTYIVKNGDSLYSVSQEKCIKLALLLKYNHLNPGDEPMAGYQLKLTR